MPAIATGYCFARAPPRRFFLAGGPLALGFVAVVVEVEGETTGDGKVLRASHLAARAARNLGTWSSRWSVVLFLPPEGPLKKTKKQAPLKKTKKMVYTFLPSKHRMEGFNAKGAPHVVAHGEGMSP